MFFVFLIMWIIFNGNFTLEIFLFGIVIAALMYAFICKFMDFSIHKDMILGKNLILVLRYFVILITEILKANIATMKLLFSEKEEIEPVLVRFRTNLKAKTTRVLLANSITLTPGTITVSLEGNELQVHCLDKSLAEGLEDCIFVKELEKLEKVNEIWIR
ncbi:Na+/H+ antiporter subunit E [Lachnospiraceae bacterium JLR.KK008]